MVVSLCSELKQHAQVFDYLNFDPMTTLEIKLWDAEFTTIQYAHTIFHQSNIFQFTSIQKTKLLSKPCPDIILLWSNQFALFAQIHVLFSLLGSFLLGNLHRLILLVDNIDLILTKYKKKWVTM